jgi:hypothetical protein
MLSAAPDLTSADDNRRPPTAFRDNHFGDSADVKNAHVAHENVFGYEIERVHSTLTIGGERGEANGVGE